MLMPLAIDMYLPSLPRIAEDFGVPGGQVQMTLSIYILGFAIGQMVYGPMADSLGRKPVILGGVIVFAFASAACALSESINMLIGMRFLHGFAAAAASVVINALMRDMFSRDEFSRSMSFVSLVMTIAPLLAPLLGALVMKWFSWHAIFWSIAIAAIIAATLSALYITETLPKERRQRFSLRVTFGQFISLFRAQRVLCYILASGFSFAGMFSFLSAGPFVYIELNGVPFDQFGLYFGFNIIFLIIMTSINGRYVRKFGALNMLRFGLTVQFLMGLFLLLVAAFNLPFYCLVVGVAMYVGGIAMITSNAMAVVLDDYPHMAGTVSSLAGTIRFGVAALVGTVIALLPAKSEWPMVSSMAFCVICAMGFILLARRFK
ncbi:MFS family multidrug transport protein [Proteus myxofaciens ATCC 19692]|uniref:Bcr/CflA family efflux transporter n=2 Tax=Proteus myxofaciens TaxID=184072 RepID=A0A198FCG8_9GAMM|nr:MFS family multidrug transport protein [Proteus myxofaciens ATCC 19692]